MVQLSFWALVCRSYVIRAEPRRLSSCSAPHILLYYVISLCYIKLHYVVLQSYSLGFRTWGWQGKHKDVLHFYSPGPVLLLYSGACVAPDEAPQAPWSKQLFRASI